MPEDTSQRQERRPDTASKRTPDPREEIRILLHLYTERQQRIRALENWRQLVSAGVFASLGAVIAGQLAIEAALVNAYSSAAEDMTPVHESLVDLLKEDRMVYLVFGMLFLAHMHSSWSQYRVFLVAISLQTIELRLEELGYINRRMRYYKINKLRTAIYFPATSMAGVLCVTVGLLYAFYDPCEWLLLPLLAVCLWVPSIAAAFRKAPHFEGAE